MSSFDIAINILENFLLAFLCYALMTKKDNRSIFCIILLGTFLTILTTVCNYIDNYGSLLGFLTNFTIILFAFYYSSDSTVYKLTISFFPIFLLEICNALTSLFFSLIYQESIDYLLNNGHYLNIVIISKGLFLFISLLVLVLKRKRKLRLFCNIDKSWWPIIMTTFSTCMITIRIFTILFTGVLEQIDAVILFLNLLIVMISIILLFQNVQKESEHRLYSAIQIEKFKKNKESYQKDEEFYQKLKILKHDMKHIYGYMHELIKKEDYDKLKLYIEEKDHLAYEQVNWCYSNNDIFNMVLKRMASKAKENNIKFEADIQIPKMLNIKDVDLYSVLSNLIENAIENSDHNNPIVRIKAIMKSEFLYLCIENTTRDNVLESNKNLETTKINKENHGYGIESVKSIVNNYHGELTFTMKETFFESLAILKAF